jgi:hypothetical protein
MSVTWKRLLLLAPSMWAAFLIHVWIASIHGFLRARGADEGATWSAGTIENAIWGGPERMQAAIPPDSPLASEVAFVIWASLFTVAPLLSIWVVALRGWRDFAGLMALQALLLFTSDIMFALVPTRPPWMDMEVVRVIAVQTGNAVDVDANPFAAVPSLHVAVPASYAAWFWWRGGLHTRRIGAALWAWTALMSVTVVYTGEHYMLDVLVGIAWAIASCLLLRRVGILYARERPQATNTGVVAEHGHVPLPRAA